jgi:hypothetical protein
MLINQILVNVRVYTCIKMILLVKGLRMFDTSPVFSIFISVAYLNFFLHYYTYKIYNIIIKAHTDRTRFATTRREFSVFKNK